MALGLETLGPEYRKYLEYKLWVKFSAESIRFRIPLSQFRAFQLVRKASKSGKSSELW